jgi:hypothetical protein
VVPIHSELTNDLDVPWIQATVQRLMASLPETHLQGLGAIVLTQTAISRKRKGRRSRANRSGIALGKYHPSWNGQPAWIELVVDEIIKRLPKPLDRIGVARDTVVGRVLFHEIGHHLDATVGSVGRTGEHGAEVWQKRLSRRYSQRRYWYLRPFVPVLWVGYRFAKMMAARQRRRRETG